MSGQEEYEALNAKLIEQTAQLMRDDGLVERWQAHCEKVLSSPIFDVVHFRSKETNRLWVYATVNTTTGHVLCKWWLDETAGIWNTHDM